MAWVRARGRPPGLVALTVLALAGGVALASGPAVAAAPPRGNLPNLRGLALNTAKHRARAAGFHHVKSHDAAGRHRKQGIDRHWKVCTQHPGAGRTAKATTVSLGVVGIHQACPRPRRAVPPIAPPRPVPPGPVPPGPATTAPAAPLSPPAEQPDLCGAPPNPMGYTFCGGSRITAPDPRTCQYYTCIPNFDNGRGYLVACVDGRVSMSGGVQGACSSHGGVGRQVYRR